MAEPNTQTTQDQQSTEPQPSPEAIEADIRAKAIEAAKEPETLATSATPAVPTAEPPREGGLDPKRLALQNARLDKQIREQKAAFDELKQQQDQLLAALKDPDKRYQTLEDQFGVTYQDWTERLVSGSKPQRDARDIELDQIKQTVQALQTQLDEKKQAEQQQAQVALNSQAENNAKTYLETNKEKYPMLFNNPKGAAILISEATRRYEAGTFTSDEELAAELEMASVNGFKSEIEKLVTVPAFVKLLNDAGFTNTAQKVPETKQTQRENQGNKPFTLTNDLSSQPTSGFDYRTANEDEINDHARKNAFAAVQAERQKQGF